MAAAQIHNLVLSLILARGTCLCPTVRLSVCWPGKRTKVMIVRHTSWLVCIKYDKLYNLLLPVEEEEKRRSALAIHKLAPV